MTNSITPQPNRAKSQSQYYVWMDGKNMTIRHRRTFRTGVLTFILADALFDGYDVIVLNAIGNTYVAKYITGGGPFQAHKDLFHFI